MTNYTNNILCLSETAEYCGVSVSTLNRLRVIQDFPKAIQISIRRIGFLKDEVDEWLLNRKRSKVGDLSEHRVKVRCPQSTRDLDQIYQRHVKAKIAS